MNSHLASPSSSHLPITSRRGVRRSTVLCEVRALLLSALAAFLLVTGGGWYLAQQITPPADDDVLSAELEQIGAADGLHPDDLNSVAAPSSPRDDVRIFIYTGPPLRRLERGGPENARISAPRDDG